MAAEHLDGTAYALRPDVVATVLDQGALLLDLESKYFFLLNPSGWAVTQLFEDGTTLEHALERCRAWGAPEADLAGVSAAVDQMFREGLLAPSSPDLLPLGEPPGEWQPVRFERQAEPLQRVIVSAFDPSIPLAE